MSPQPEVKEVAASKGMVTLIAVLGYRRRSEAAHASLMTDGNIPLAIGIAARVAGQLADQILVKIALQDISQLTYIGRDAFSLLDGSFSHNTRRTGERSSHPKRPPLRGAGL